MYIYLSSNQSDNFFIGNSPAGFRVKLPKVLYLSEKSHWHLAILDIDLPQFNQSYTTDYITINSSLCEPSVLNGSLCPILNRVYVKQLIKNSSVFFDAPRYVRLSVDVIDTVDIYLRDSTGNIPSFKEGTVSCTLHLIQDD